MDAIPNRLNDREKKALQAMEHCMHGYAMPGEMVGVGKATLDELVRRGFAVTGPSRHTGVTGYALTDAGREALIASCAVPSQSRN
jgi:hypothetical protein